MPARADRQHRLAQIRLAELVGGRLGRLILALDDITAQAAMDAYNQQAVRIVAGGQQQAARFAITYMAATVPPGPAAAPATTTRALEGRLIDKTSPVTTSPMLKVWSELKDGTAEALARELGASYAARLSSGDLAVAERGGLEEGARAGGAEVTGWRKDIAPGSCEWCEQFADETFSSAEDVPWHDHDKCGVTPVLAGEEETDSG